MYTYIYIYIYVSVYLPACCSFRLLHIFGYIYIYIYILNISIYLCVCVHLHLYISHYRFSINANLVVPSRPVVIYIAHHRLPKMTSDVIKHTVKSAYETGVHFVCTFWTSFGGAVIRRRVSLEVFFAS